MYRHYRTVVIILLCMNILSCSRSVKLQSTCCQLKYPILLVHGIALPDDMKLVPYWGNIPDHLRNRGATVFLSNHNAWAEHKVAAQFLKDRVEQIIAQTGAQKVNIIAHSKGGIESRYMISCLDMSDKVASLTTISTPHRGSMVADYLFEKIDSRQMGGKFIITLASVVGVVMGDSRPDPDSSGRSLTKEYMESFNENVPDMPQVYYQSYTSLITEEYPALFWQKLYELHKNLDGPNDGLVSEQSARWGVYRGVVKVGDVSQINHGDIVDLYQFSGRRVPDLHLFYIDMVHDLKDMGF
ncbi:MAG: triacylglycerol lipase [Spirochaetes bacterium]|nr:triacylglycerol lipase [Spirochaetota bacterium]